MGALMAFSGPVLSCSESTQPGGEEVLLDSSERIVDWEDDISERTDGSKPFVDSVESDAENEENEEDSSPDAGTSNSSPDGNEGQGLDTLSDGGEEDAGGSSPDAADVDGEDGEAVSVYDPPPEWWGDPIASKPFEWAWVDFPESRCADGSPTGLGINVAPGATRALVYFEGGGACWNFATCFGVVQTSFHLSGYDEGSFKGLIAEFYKNSLLLNREDGNNPLADAHLVFVPYCTGDAFLGTQVKTLEGLLWQEEEIHFWGRNNVKEYIKRLAPTFENVEHLVIAGGSAGGFGAGFSWSLFQDFFPGIRVDILDDSGPPVNPAASQWEEWKEAWNPEFPEGCPGCEESVEALLDYFREELLNNGKMGLMSYKSDAIISTFFGLLPFQFQEKLMALCDLLDEEPNAQYFVVPGLLHTLTIIGYENIEAEDGTPLWWWVNQMIDDDPNWSSYRP
jgi:hypothetical protein